MLHIQLTTRSCHYFHAHSSSSLLQSEWVNECLKQTKTKHSSRWGSHPTATHRQTHHRRSSVPSTFNQTLSHSSELVSLALEPRKNSVFGGIYEAWQLTYSTLLAFLGASEMGWSRRVLCVRGFSWIVSALLLMPREAHAGVGSDAAVRFLEAPPAFSASSRATFRFEVTERRNGGACRSCSITCKVRGFNPFFTPMHIDLEAECCINWYGNFVCTRRLHFWHWQGTYIGLEYKTPFSSLWESHNLSGYVKASRVKDYMKQLTIIMK